MPEQNNDPVKKKRSDSEILEAAAEKIVTEHDLERYDGESALHSLCWSLGDHIAYEKALEELVGHTIDLAKNIPRPVAPHEDTTD